GAEGPLGVMTVLGLALAGLPVARRRGGFVFPDAVSAARATADESGGGVDVAAIEFLDAASVGAIARFAQADLVEAPSLLVEVHGSASGVDETWQVVADVAASSGGTPIALANPWAIREQATRAIEAGRAG